MFYVNWMAGGYTPISQPFFTPWGARKERDNLLCLGIYAKVGRRPLDHEAIEEDRQNALNARVEEIIRKAGS